MTLTRRPPVTLPQSQPEPQHWRHAVEVTPIVAGGLYAAAAVGAALHLPWWAIPGLVLVAAVAVVLVVASATGNGVAWWYSVGCSLVAAGWSAYAAVASPWSIVALFALLIPAAGLGLLYPAVAGHHKQAVAAALKLADLQRQVADARKWPDLFARLGCKGITVTEIVESRAGQSLRLRLPATGKVTFRRLEKLTDGLEAAARLRHGAIRFEQGDHAGEVLMHLSVKDVLSQTVSYPDDLSDLTVNRPFPVGLFEDGALCELLYREVKVLIVAISGGGKSNLMNVLIAQLGRCVDTLLFMIDLKGGRAAYPWIRPWLDLRAPRPVLDWVATTRDEADRMLDTLSRGVQARSHSGSGGEKITPSAGQPAVILIVDELSVITGEGRGPSIDSGETTNSKIARKITEYVQLGRSEAMDAIVATQRATVTMIGGGDLKSQFGVRIGLNVQSESDARLVVPDNESVAKLLPKLKHKGSGVVSTPGSRIMPVKFYRIEPEDVYRLAEELGDRRPVPDPLLEAALGEDYAMRWSMARAGHIPGFARFAQQHAAGQSGADLTTGDQELHRTFDEITAGLDIPGPDDEDRPAHPGRNRMLDLIRGAGVMGMTPLRIERMLQAEGMGVVRQTIQKWLALELAAGRVEKASYGRYKAAGR